LARTAAEIFEALTFNTDDDTKLFSVVFTLNAVYLSTWLLAPAIPSVFLCQP